MKLSDESLNRFMRLYQEFYGEELTVNEARAMASRVVLLYDHLTQPLPGEHNLTPPSQTGDRPSSLPADESSQPSS